MMTENRSLLFLFFFATDIDKNLIQSFISVQTKYREIIVSNQRRHSFRICCVEITYLVMRICLCIRISQLSQVHQILISSSIKSARLFKNAMLCLFFLPLVISNNDMHNQIQKYSLQLKAIIYLFILFSQKQLMCFFFKPLFLIYLVVTWFSKHPCYFLNSEAIVYRTVTKEICLLARIELACLFF